MSRFRVNQSTRRKRRATDEAAAPVAERAEAPAQSLEALRSSALGAAERGRAALGLQGVVGNVGVARQIALLRQESENSAQRVKASEVTLRFVPDEQMGEDQQPMGLIHVFVKGKEVAMYQARGGRPEHRADPNNPGHTYDPTPSGIYRIAKGKPHISRSWKYSQIPWGAPIREVDIPRGKDVQFSQSGKKWRSTLRLRKRINRDDIGKAEVVTAVLAALDQESISRDQLSIDEKGHLVVTSCGDQYTTPVRDGTDITASIPSQWDLNDFGAIAFHVVGTQTFIHTTSVNEAEYHAGLPEKLDFSHGCIHIKPSDRNQMIEQGYLQGGIRLIVEPYRSPEQWGKPR